MESYNVYSSKGVGKRMVKDRQKGQNQIRVQEVQSGRRSVTCSRQAEWSGTKSRNRQGSKLGGLEKGDRKKQEDGITGTGETDQGVTKLRFS